jgi:hypothetical protein
VQKNARFILKRVLDRGDTNALKWIQAHYTLKEIQDVIMTSRDISRKTATFWTNILNVDPNHVVCLQKPTLRAIKTVAQLPTIKSSYLREQI